MYLKGTFDKSVYIASELRKAVFADAVDGCKNAQDAQIAERKALRTLIHGRQQPALGDVLK